MTTTPPIAELIDRLFDRLTHPARSTTDLFLIRHGQTDANLTRRFVGRTDIPLDPLGVAQAARIADRMRNEPLDALFTSPMLRARQTAEAVSRTVDCDVQVVAGLEEIDFGDAEGLTLEEIDVQFPELRTLRESVDDIEFGWPAGERRVDFHARVLSAITGILARSEGQRVGVVCHGGVIASIVAHIDGGPPNDFLRYGVLNCSITHVQVGPDGSRIHLWNAVDHLDEVITELLQIRPVATPSGEE